MDIDVITLDKDCVRLLAQTLQNVLDSRTHRRVYMGDEVVVKGSLSKALKLPEILRMLDSPHTERQKNGKALFAELWATLSANTRQRTLAKLEWYEPRELPWDDPRSNRRLILVGKQP